MERASKHARAIMRSYKKRNPFLFFRPSFLLHGLVVSAPLEVLEKLAALEEVVAIEENRKFVLPAPRLQSVRSSH